MRKRALVLLTILFSVSYSASGQNLDKVTDASYSKVMDLLQKLSPSRQRLVLKPVSLKPENRVGQEMRETAEGGVHSGGGNLTYVDGESGLLDLYLYNQNAFFNQTPGHRLARTKAFKVFGMDRFEVKSSVLIQKILAQTEKWRSSSPIVTNIIQNSLLELPIYYVNFNLNFDDRMAFLPPSASIDSKRLELAAYYFSGFGVFLSGPVFESLSETSQMALFIHEALRHDQLTYGTGVNNEDIQKITAAVLDDPGKISTLDRKEFAQPQIRRAAILERRLLVNATEIVSEYCRVMWSNCNLNPLLLVTPMSAERVCKMIGGTCSGSPFIGKDLLLQMLSNTITYRGILPLGPKRDEVGRLTDLMVTHFRDLQLETFQYIGGERNPLTLDAMRVLQGTGWIDEELVAYNKSEVKVPAQDSALLKFVQEMVTEKYFK